MSPSLQKSLAPLLLLALVLLPFAQGFSQEKAKLKERDPARPVVAEDEDEFEDGEDAPEEGKGLELGKLLPLNKPNLRVKIPGFDKGKLATMVEAQKLTRIDESNLRLEDATIQLIPQALTIRLRSALYNTDGAMLSSNEKTTVSSKEFTMTGASMDFDTTTGKGTMRGPVRMIIHNVDAMSGDEAGAEAPEGEVPFTARTATKEKPKQ